MLSKSFMIIIEQYSKVFSQGLSNTGCLSFSVPTLRWLFSECVWHSLIGNAGPLRCLKLGIQQSRWVGSQTLHGLFLLNFWLCNIMFLGFISMGLAGTSWVTESYLFLFQTIIAYREIVCNTRWGCFLSWVVCSLTHTLGSSHLKKKKTKTGRNQ